jgi:hypothetical protein
MTLAASHWVYPWAVCGRSETGGESPHKVMPPQAAFRATPKIGWILRDSASRYPLLLVRPF